MPFPPEFTLSEFLPYLLNRAAEESSGDFARMYKERYGLLRTEWRVLFHLGQIGGMTATEIGQRSKIHKTKISRAVAALQKRRLLVRERDENDKRSEVLTLSPAGQKMFEALASSANLYNDSLLRDIQPEDRVVLLRCLKQIIK